MPSDSLYEALARAYSLPSRGTRNAQAGLNVLENAGEGYLKGQAIGDQIRQRRLSQQTLNEALGGRGLEGIGNLTGESGAIQHPNVVAEIELQKALKESGSVPKFQQGNFNVDNRLTRFNPYAGQYEYADAPGTIVKPGGKIVPNAPPGSTTSVISGSVNTSPRVAPTIPASESDKLADLNSMKEALGVVRNNYDPSFVGPYDARMQTAKQTTGFGATTRGALFSQSVQDIKDRLLRARSGAQINEQEYRRLVALVPDQYKSEVDFLAKMDRFDQVLNSTIASKRQELMRAGYRGASTLPNISTGQSPERTAKTYQKTARNAQGVVIGTNDNWATFEPVQ